MFDHVMEEGYLLITFFCNLTKNQKTELTDKLYDLIQKVKIQPIVLDMKEVNYVDSSGVGLLVMLVKYLMEHDLKIALYNISGDLRETFRMTRMYDVLGVCESKDEAIQYVMNKDS